jgi:MarR family transcriptional regulator, 2-MHQ and catechol-resistance regulon repressor
MPRAGRRNVREPEKLGRALRAYHDLLDTAEVLGERMSRQLESWNLTITQFDVLEMLRREGPQYQSEVSRRFRCSRQNVKDVVYRLEELGLVSRKASHLARVDGQPGEGVRIVLVGLTAEGEKLIAMVAPRYAKVVKAELRALEGREQQSLSRLCRKLKEGDPVRFVREMRMKDPGPEAVTSDEWGKEGE